MQLVDVNDFTEEKECTYKDERYSVRDNGAVLRHTRPNKRKRRNDNEWTFGNVIPSNGYLHLTNVRIHRIVATAFHGEPPNPQYVVDHIDTNRQNNRPENLRWMTRLENTLNNPITRSKIEYLCGSVEAFLENPSMINSMQLEPNYEWMRRVSKEEAKNTLENLTKWANRARASHDRVSRGGSINERIHGNEYQTTMDYLKGWAHAPSGEECSPSAAPKVEQSLTVNAAQYRFKEKYNFPFTPPEIGLNPLKEYAANIDQNMVLGFNDSNKLIARSIKLMKERPVMFVICERETSESEKCTDKPWQVVEITFQDGVFVHTNSGLCSEEQEAIYGVSFIEVGLQNDFIR